MSPMMIRIFILVGIALAAASMQLKARADSLVTAPQAQQACAAAPDDWRQP